jgi:hypothetical protein
VNAPCDHKKHAHHICDVRTKTTCQVLCLERLRGHPPKVLVLYSPICPCSYGSLELKIVAALEGNMSSELRGINPKSLPTSESCEDCLRMDGWWLHLRRCAECGHVACCDSSPNQHAAKHAAVFGHPIVRSFEPLQTWFYNYEKQKIVRGRRLPPPQCHPASQAAPGPEGRVPTDWESLLREV